MSKYSLFFFGNPTNKTVTRTAYTWEPLIANHLDQSEILSCGQVQFITLLFWRSTTVLRHFPPIKLKLRLQIGWRLPNSKTTKTKSLCFDQSKTRKSNQIIFITLFSRIFVRLCCAFQQPPQSKLCKDSGPKLFCRSQSTNGHVLTFHHPIFSLHGSYIEHQWRCSEPFQVCRVCKQRSSWV
jgi:hypothetical protein